MSLLYSIIISPIELIIEVIYVISCRLFVHPGISVIVVSILLNLLILPMYRHADALQKKERKVQAAMADILKHIRKTFSGNERFMMQQTCYRQHGYKPYYALRGSVSLLLQIPFFIAAYHFLSNLQSLQGVSFLGIRDLGAPDEMLAVGAHNINLLPVLMTLINLLSGMLYLRGAQMREKLQIYLMALLFLVLLYNSPAGLVLYWTCNNVFSLIKNVISTSPHKKEIRCLLIAASGLLLLLLMKLGVLPAKFTTHVIAVALPLFSAALFLSQRKKKYTSWERMLPSPFVGDSQIQKQERLLFFLGCLLLTLLAGLVIPSAIIATSPTDFIDLSHYTNPLLNYIPSVFCVAAGFFLLWPHILFSFSGTRAQKFASAMISLVAAAAYTDYFLFSGNYGLISAELIYDAPPSPASREGLLNLLVLAALFFLIRFVYKKKRILVFWASVILSVAALIIGFSQLQTAARGLSGVEPMIAERRNKASDNGKLLTLSTDGQNVVVIMLDRAMSRWVPFIFEELSQLKQQFDGFCYYPNTVSQGGSTLFGTPGLFGGYEYIPENTTKRPELLLKDKHNEALSLMPLMFRREGYQVTVCDEPFGNYSFETITDLSFYDSYEDIEVYYSQDIDLLNEGAHTQTERRRRNFFCYSLMRSAPVALQPTLYWNGTYFSSDMAGMYIGEKFLKAYTVLNNLNQLTQIEKGSTNHFLILCNETSHEYAELQLPDYDLVALPDNSDYNTSWRETPDGQRIELTPRQFQLYCTNAVSYLRIGTWLDMLRSSGVYDNTRIILVADHGADSEEGILSEGLDINIERYMPLLMVKDFHSTGFTVHDDFMTNADTPFLAMRGVINNMHNPYTGTLVGDAQKERVQHIIIEGSRYFYDYRERFDFNVDGTVWYAVSEDVRNPSNWEKLDDLY